MPDSMIGPRPRLDVIDFWRGYLLCTIFVNHVPGNAFEPLTQKNFGFSDSAEGFVFLSGLSLALAYGRRVAGGDWGGVTASLARRSIKLYGLHIALSLIGVAIFVAGAMLGDGGSLLAIHGRDLAVKAPTEMLLGVVSLGHQFGYFNILPMYILMVVIAPVLLWMSRASSWPMVAASFVLYDLAVTRGWNLPTWPVKGTWFFDPFAWQFLMAVGLAIGLAQRKRPLPVWTPLLCLSAVVVAFSAFAVTDGFSYWPGLENKTRAWAELDKTTLGLGRLVHFFSLAYLIYALRVADWMRGSYAFRPLCMIGRHGLWMFCLLSLMAAGAQVVVQYLGHTVFTDVIMIAAGLFVLYAVARVLESRRDTRRRVAGAGVRAAPKPSAHPSGGMTPAVGA